MNGDGNFKRKISNFIIILWMRVGIMNEIYLTFDIEPFWTNIPQRYDRQAWDDLDDASNFWTLKFINYCLQSCNIKDLLKTNNISIHF